MKLTLTESHGFFSVEIAVQILHEACRPDDPAYKTALEIAAIADENPNLCLDEIHTQLLPKLREVRLLTEASLAKMVLDSLRDSLPNAKSSGTREEKP